MQADQGEKMITDLRPVIFGRAGKIFTLFANHNGMFLECLWIDQGMENYLKGKYQATGVHFPIKSCPDTFITALDTVIEGMANSKLFTITDVEGYVGKLTVEGKTNYLCSFRMIDMATISIVTRLTELKKIKAYLEAYWLC